MNENPDSFLHTRSRARVLLIGGSVLLVTVLIGLGYWTWTTFDGQMRSNAFFMPKELHGATFVSLTPERAGAYTRTLWVYSVHPTPEKLIDIARVNEVFVTAGVSDTGAYEIRLDDTPIHTSPSVIRDIDLSPNGSSVVFSEQVETTEGAVWTIRVINDGSIQDIGPGFAAYFLSDDALLIFSSKGVSSHIISTGVVREVLAYPLPSPVPTAMNRETGHFAFLDPMSKELLVFRTDVVGYGVTAVGGYAVSGTSFVLGENGVYVLEQQPNPSTIFKYSFGSEVKETFYTLYQPFGFARITN